MANRRIIFVSVVCSLLAVFAAQTYSSDLFSSSDNPKVYWESLIYQKKLYNPAVPQQDRDSRAAESLTLSCGIQMSDPMLLLGMVPDVTIEQITDSQGNEVDISLNRSQSGRKYFVDVSLLKWLNLNMKIGGLDTTGGTRRSLPKLDLDPRLLEQAGGQIKLLKGYCTGLMAESIEYVDMPFRPSESWIRVTPDLEIRIVKANNVQSMYHYEIEHRPAIKFFTHGFSVGDDIPIRLILGEQIIAQNNSSGVGGGGSGTSGTSGSSVSKGSGIGRAERIRYVIAINAAHKKIPFEFQNIPLSAPTEPKTSYLHNSKRTANLPVIDYLRKKGRTATTNNAHKMRNPARPADYSEGDQLFAVDWHSITYNSKLYNPAVSKKQNTKSLSVHCDAKILDPKRVIGTCDEPIIERITDGSGRTADISQAKFRPDRMCYKTPRYRSISVFTPPSTLVQLEIKARMMLGLPLKRRHFPRRSSKLKPVRMKIPLNPDMMGKGHKEIGQINGHFHALTAESYKNIQVPLKASDKWVRLTSDVEVRVASTWQDEFGTRFDIKERSQASGRLYADQPLPDGIVVDRQNVASGGSQIRSSFIRGGKRLPVSASVNGHDGNLVNKIDYRIAVDPNHHRIMFKLEHIPLPEP